jgi:hypothetical protein
MVVIKFTNPAEALEFSKAYNGKPFDPVQVRNYFVLVNGAILMLCEAGNLPRRACAFSTDTGR